MHDPRARRRARTASRPPRAWAIVAEQAAAIDAGDVGTALDADTRFHHAMVVASGLEGVWRVVGEARDLHHRIRAIAVPELGSAAQAIRDHRAIVRAVCEGEASRAARAMAKHLERNFALAKAIAALHPDYFDGTTRA
jgi:DNA-binding GntR family transcriptional regulator